MRVLLQGSGDQEAGGGASSGSPSHQGASQEDNEDEDDEGSDGEEVDSCVVEQKESKWPSGEAVKTLRQVGNS